MGCNKKKIPKPGEFISEDKIDEYFDLSKEGVFITDECSISQIDFLPKRKLLKSPSVKKVYITKK